MRLTTDSAVPSLAARRALTVSAFASEPDFNVIGVDPRQSKYEMEALQESLECVDKVASHTLAAASAPGPT